MDCSPPGSYIHIFPTEGWNPRLLWSPTLADGFFTSSATWEAAVIFILQVMFILELVAEASSVPRLGEGGGWDLNETPSWSRGTPSHLPPESGPRDAA